MKKVFTLKAILKLTLFSVLISSTSLLAQQLPSECENEAACTIMRDSLEALLAQVNSRLASFQTPALPQNITMASGAVYRSDINFRNSLGDSPYVEPTYSVASPTDAPQSHLGIIWGDTVMVNQLNASECTGSSIGSTCKLSALAAEEYCVRRQAHLPTPKEFIRLREHMGAQDIVGQMGSHVLYRSIFDGYQTNHSLPNFNHFFAIAPNSRGFGVFDGPTGRIYMSGINEGSEQLTYALPFTPELRQQSTFAFRCVVREYSIHATE